MFRGNGDVGRLAAYLPNLYASSSHNKISLD